MSYFDFNSASEQASFDLIPKGTLVHVRMTVRPGGFDDPAQGWTGGYATRNAQTGSVYLNCEFVVLEGEFARRKLWSLIGLSSPKGPEWANMGRSFMKAILNSARGIHPADNSPAAQNARRIAGFAELDGIEFLGKVDWEKDQHGQDKSVIKSAVTADHRDYAARMGAAPRAPAASGGFGSGAPATPMAPAASTPPAASRVPTRPAWAQ
ncbi:MAG: hypothetical protein CRU78_17180 [Candidatus Accumulibacter phosphatis]|uniref:DUF669 domain-containing protein n=1 Tax=Candidatus Accumulibacter phosphatis TaxID=327160 RepID=A0A6A7RXK7_9PROT|nr:hypothetical protein [Candidatus Accumulibacter phosphatis]